MFNRRTFLASFAVAALATLSAQAATPVPYSEAAFKDAQKTGTSILIAIHANWCPTCKAQAPILNGLLDTNKFTKVVTFRVDFDDQADIVRAFGAQSQSTLITFKGDKEMGRTVGDTDPVSIEVLLATAL